MKSTLSSSTASPWAGSLCIAVPLGFLVFFTALGITFDYPKVLRTSPAEVLTAFAAKQATILPFWTGMMVSALLFIPLSMAVARALEASEGFRRNLIVVGAIAGVVQAVGFSRWVFAVPWLARSYLDPAASAATRDTVVVVFEVLNRLLGVGLGETFGYLMTGTWTLMLCRALFATRPALSLVGTLCATGILLGVLTPTGLVDWTRAVTSIAYTLWAIWLIVLGVLWILPAVYRQKTALVAA